MNDVKLRIKIANDDYGRDEIKPLLSLIAEALAEISDHLENISIRMND